MFYVRWETWREPPRVRPKLTIRQQAREDYAHLTPTASIYLTRHLNDCKSCSEIQLNRCSASLEFVEYKGFRALSAIYDIDFLDR